MNIALSTFILFLALIPGILFRRFYYSEEFSKEYFKESFFGIFISTFIPSLIFQTIWYFLAKVFKYSVDMIILADLISQEPKEASIFNIQQYVIQIIIYNSTMFLAAILSGYYSKQIVRYYKWDRKWKHFRFQNSWHYVLKGEFLDFPRANFELENDSVESIEFVFVDAILEIDGKGILLDGILVDYELSKEGGLESISLKNVQRRLLKDDCKINDDGSKESNSDKYYPIDGHLVLLKYSEIKNLNFSYYKLTVNNSGLYYPELVS